MLAETVQQAIHVLSLPTGQKIRSPTMNAKNTPIIILPEMANAVICPETGKSLKHQEIITMIHAVICPETGKSLKHQELITMLWYKIKWMRSTAN
jgi:hypothetical protein